MTDHYFNTLEYARQLEAAGVPEAQAEVHANALTHVLEKCLSAAGETATLKSELSFKISELAVTLRAEIKELEATLRAEIKELEVTLRAEIKELEVTLRSEIEEVEARFTAKLAGVHADLLRRIDKVETRMEERFRSQRAINGLIIAMQVGLYVMMAGLYLR